MGDPVEMRCENGIKFGELIPEQHLVEFKCRSARCGAERGTVVLHRFDVVTGRMAETETFRDPSISSIDKEG